MNLSISFTPLAQWLTLVVDGLKKVLWVRMGDQAAAPLISLLWNRLGRLTRRFDALVARLEAGRPAAARRQRTRPARAPPEPGALRLPRDPLWLSRMLKHEAALCAGRLQALLADPQTAALLAAAPEAGRILRPLCRLLGVHPEGALALPSDAGKPPPRPRPVKPPPPPPQSAIAQVCTAIAARTPGAMTVTTNFAPPRRKPPWWPRAR